MFAVTTLGRLISAALLGANKDRVLDVLEEGIGLDLHAAGHEHRLLRHDGRHGDVDTGATERINDADLRVSPLRML